MLVKYSFLKNPLVFALFFVISLKMQAQESTNFWSNVKWGGYAGLDFGTGYSSFTLAPSGIYQFNKYVSVGTGISYSHINLKQIYTTNMYGVSLIGLFNPIENIQFSTELEQTLVETTLKNPIYNDSFWVTGLFLGVGYHSNDITMGVRYNVLFNEEKSLYRTALTPFVRFYF
jgi:long-subunit fatty acid transport protein